jgi:Immunity protein Imm5
MAIPEDLRNYLILRLEKVRQDPQHRLKPYYRLALYNKIRLLSEPFAQSFLAHLQLVTVEYLAPLWQSEMLGTIYQTLPELTLNLAEDLLDGTVTTKSLTYDYVKGLEAQIQQYYYQQSPVVSARAKYIATAFSQCLNPHNIFPYQDLSTLKGTFTIDESHEDSIYLGIGGDIAATALIAYAGIFHTNQWSSAFDLQKSLAFWVWWLTKAIPSAWERTGRKFSKLNQSDDVAEDSSRLIQKLLPNPIDVAWLYKSDQPYKEVYYAYGKHTIAVITKQRTLSTFQAVISNQSEDQTVKPKIFAAKTDFTNLDQAKRWCEERLI